jgi:hypothetical protein
VQISTVDKTFRFGTFVSSPNIAPVAGPGGVYDWNGIDGTKTHWWRIITTAVGNAEYPSDVRSFPPKCVVNTGGSVGYYIPFRDNTVVPAPFETFKNIGLVRTNGLPLYGESLLRQKYNFVVNYSKNAGWNPAFMLTLWVEESGATTNIGYLGCCLGSIEENLPAGINAPFFRNKTDFEDFMWDWCGPNTTTICSNNPNFIGNVALVYDQLVPCGTYGARKHVGCP